VNLNIHFECSGGQACCVHYSRIGLPNTDIVRVVPCTNTLSMFVCASHKAGPVEPLSLADLPNADQGTERVTTLIHAGRPYVLLNSAVLTWVAAHHMCALKVGPAYKPAVPLSAQELQQGVAAVISAARSEGSWPSSQRYIWLGAMRAVPNSMLTTLDGTTPAFLNAWAGLSADSSSSSYGTDNPNCLAAEVDAQQSTLSPVIRSCDAIGHVVCVGPAQEQLTSSPSPPAPPSSPPPKPPQPAHPRPPSPPWPPPVPPRPPLPVGYRPANAATTRGTYSYSLFAISNSAGGVTFSAAAAICRASVPGSWLLTGQDAASITDLMGALTTLSDWSIWLGYHTRVVPDTTNIWALADGGPAQTLLFQPANDTSGPSLVIWPQCEAGQGCCATLKKAQSTPTEMHIRPCSGAVSTVMCMAPTVPLTASAPTATPASLQYATELDPGPFLPQHTVGTRQYVALGSAGLTWKTSMAACQVKGGPSYNMAMPASSAELSAMRSAVLKALGPGGVWSGWTERPRLIWLGGQRLVPDRLLTAYDSSTPAATFLNTWANLSTDSRISNNNPNCLAADLGSSTATQVVLTPAMRSCDAWGRVVCVSAAEQPPPPNATTPEPPKPPGPPESSQLAPPIPQPFLPPSPGNVSTSSPVCTRTGSVGCLVLERNVSTLPLRTFPAEAVGFVSASGEKLQYEFGVVTEPGGVFEMVRKQGAAPRFTFSMDAPGTYEVYVCAFDTAGNRSCETTALTLLPRTSAG